LTFGKGGWEPATSSDKSHCGGVAGGGGVLAWSILDEILRVSKQRNNALPKPRINKHVIFQASRIIVRSLNFLWAMLLRTAGKL